MWQDLKNLFYGSDKDESGKGAKATSFKSKPNASTDQEHIYDDFEDISEFDLKSASSKGFKKFYDQVKSKGAKTIDASVGQLNKALPYIYQAGYHVDEIEVGVGLTPGVKAYLSVERKLSKEEQADLLQDIRGQTLLHLTIQNLFKAQAMQDKLKFKHFSMSGLILDISLLPTISLRFLPEGQLLDRQLLDRQLLDRQKKKQNLKDTLTNRDDLDLNIPDHL